MQFTDLLKEMRNQIGDNDPLEPNITDEELTRILNTSSSEYSRLKNYLKFFEIPYNPEENVYNLPLDSFKVKEVRLDGTKINFIDNLNQIILYDSLYVDSGTLKITYSKYFKPEEIDEREIDIFLLYAEALCYKLMASKSAELIKFSTGEKTVDESGISKRYLELYKNANKDFKNRIVKAYGRRADNIKENLDYGLPYPTMGETP